MKYRVKTATFMASASFVTFASALPNGAFAQSASEPASAQAAANPIEDIIVTAQKREQNANTVPMSVAAASGEMLVAAGVSDTRDLAKLVPSFNFALTQTGTPVYSIRGVGLQDASLAAVPTVSLYLDEAPVPYSLMSRIAGFDLERVEVLKGPQGTLFGQNSTGGAIGYVAAKPTDHLTAGFDASYGRFNAVDFQGFVSGPLTDTLNVRLATSVQEGGAWQRSYTRSDHLGAARREYVRLLLDWHPTDRLKVELNASGGIDKSDLQAARLVAVAPQRPGVLPPGLVNYPLPPADPRAADWDPGENLRRDDNQLYLSATVNYDLTPGILLKTIGSYQEYNADFAVDADGTAYQNTTVFDRAHIKDTYAELRLQSQGQGKFKWVLGANFDHDAVFDSPIGAVAVSSLAAAVPGHPFHATVTPVHQTSDAYAGYASGTWTPTPSLDIEGGVRFTQVNKKFLGCTADTGDGELAAAGEFLVLVTTGKQVTIPPGGCASVNSNGLPGQAGLELDQNNVSWRVGATWRVGEHKILYANISRGYKAGTFPGIAVTRNVQFAPAGQESVLAYEVGSKLSLMDRRLQLNGALFYYNYTDKQVLGRIVDPVFGPLSALVNIPRSSIKGAELEVTYAPVHGLTLHAGATYVESEIRSNFITPDQLGASHQVRGESFPNTPKWSVIGDIKYKWSLSRHLLAFAGASAQYQSATNGSLGKPGLFNIPAYAILDLHAGVATNDGRWRLTFWGRNVTNKLYFSNTSYFVDTVVGYAGMPATYGATLGFRY